MGAARAAADDGPDLPEPTGWPKIRIGVRPGNRDQRGSPATRAIPSSPRWRYPRVARRTIPRGPVAMARNLPLQFPRDRATRPAASGGTTADSTEARPRAARPDRRAAPDHPSAAGEPLSRNRRSLTSRRPRLSETRLRGDSCRGYSLTHFSWRWLSRMASQSSTSRWPSAKVGKNGSAEKSPAAMDW